MSGLICDGYIADGCIANALHGDQDMVFFMVVFL